MEVLIIHFRRYLAIGLSFIILLSTGCAYRFSNVAMKPPEGITTIAVEAVYDTGNEVIPHELLWQALQRAFAENGRLRLTSRDEADAIVRAHITASSFAPVGAPSRLDEKEDPKLDGKSTPPPPSQIRKLTRASSWTNEEAISIGVNIEIYDLNRGNILFKRNYGETANYRSYRSSDQSLTQTHFMLMEEGQNAKLAEISKRIADKVVADFLL